MNNQNLSYFRRKKQLYEGLTITGYILIGLCFLFYIPIGTSNIDLIPLIFIGFISGGLLSGIASNKFKKLSNEFKANYLPQEIKKIYPDSTYELNKGFDKEEIYNSKVLSKQDRYFSEDLITGTYEGVKFQVADVKLQDVRSTGKSTTVVTVFQGQVYKFEFNKPFKSNILINQPSFFKNLFGWNRVKTESVEFNSELSVYSDNEHEVFYILTPHFMERIYQLDRKYQDKISFSFINNQLYIAINTKKDNFDLRMFRELDLSIIDDYKEQLYDIKEFIHHLNLDKNLFNNKMEG